MTKILQFKSPRFNAGSVCVQCDGRRVNSCPCSQTTALCFFLQLHTHEVVEVCAKILYQVELQRKSLDQMWGFSVEAELMENADRQDELCCYVSRVEDKSVAMHNGIIKVSPRPPPTAMLFVPHCASRVACRLGSLPNGTAS